MPVINRQGYELAENNINDHFKLLINKRWQLINRKPEMANECWTLMVGEE